MYMYARSFINKIFTRNCVHVNQEASLFVVSHFLFVYVHCTIYKRDGTRVGGCRRGWVSCLRKNECLHSSSEISDEGCRNGGANKCRNKVASIQQSKE